MKQYTTTEQTTKLIKLGFKPESIEFASDCEVVNEYGIERIECINPQFSIGELIEILEEVASVVISYSYQKNGYYVRVIIPKRKGGGMYRISQIELIDALYDMIVKLKEKEVI